MTLESLLRTVGAFALKAVDPILYAALGVAGLAAAGWVLARVARAWGTDPTRIPPPVQKFEKLPSAEVDALRKAAAARRQRAAHRHEEGHAIETGEPERKIELAEPTKWRRPA